MLQASDCFMGMCRLYAGGIRTDEPVQFLRPRVPEVNMRQDMLNLHPKKTISQLSESDEVNLQSFMYVYAYSKLK